MEQQYRGRVADAGRVVIPADIRETLGLKNGTEVVFRVDEMGVRITPVDLAIKRVKKLFASLAPADVVLSDEILRDRRNEGDDE